MLGPRELAAGCAVPFVFSLAGAGWIWLQGFPLVIVFALLESAAVAAAFVAYARHATDCETLRLAGGRLQVELRCGGALHCSNLAVACLNVQRDAAEGLIELRAPGQCLRIGRHLRPQARQALERELRAALRASALPTEPVAPFTQEPLP